MKYKNGKEHYQALVTGWHDRAEKLRKTKYKDWHSSIEERLKSQYFKRRLAHLLGLGKVTDIRKHGRLNQLIAAVTGFGESEIEKLRWMPSDNRSLMFAFAFVLGYEYRLITTKAGELIVDCSPELNQYFDDADMPLPDYRNLDDYIAICAAMYYEKCNEKKEYGKNIIETLYDLQEMLRKQMNAYILNLNVFVGWPDFFEYYATAHKLSNAKIKKITGFTKYNTLEWKKTVPKEPEALFMICTMFEFTLIQSVQVFDKFYNHKDRPQRPDFENADDLRWMYLIENYRKLNSLRFADQIQAVKDYYNRNHLTRSSDLSILQYYEIFKDITFRMDQKRESSVSEIEQTRIISDSAQLAAVAAVSPYDRVFIHAADGSDPVTNAATEHSLGHQMDILHASDASTILWYRSRANTKKKNDASGDLISHIYYRQSPDNMENNMKEGSELLLDWIGNNSVNGYLNNCYNLSGFKGTLGWNKKLTDLQLQQGGYPKRKDLIICGVLISMPEKGINALLKSYGYKPLSKHDYTEYVLILILNDIAKTFRGEFRFEEEYTANRAESDHMIQNIGKRRKADRGERGGYQYLLMEWYPQWFYKEDGKISTEVVELRHFVDNQKWYRVTPSQYFEGWSIRRHVLWCLHAAGFPEKNWLVNGLKNPENQEEYPFG